MAAGGEIEPHERIARLQQGEKHRLIGLAAGIRLHIGETAAEQPGDPLDRQPFDDVDELAAAIIAAARIAFGIFVGEHRSLRLEHGARDDVFGGDQLDLVALAAELERDGLGDLGIGFGERRREKTVRPNPMFDLGFGMGLRHCGAGSSGSPRRAASSTRSAGFPDGPRRRGRSNPPCPHGIVSPYHDGAPE